MKRAGLKVSAATHSLKTIYIANASLPPSRVGTLYEALSTLPILVPASLDAQR